MKREICRGGSLRKLISGVFAAFVSLTMALSLVPAASVQALAGEADAYFALQPLSTSTSGICGDDATWALDGYGTLTISGTGDVDSAPWYSSGLWDTVTTVIVEDGITSISVYEPFGDSTSLTSVSLGDTLTNLGEDAFANCTSLTSVAFGASIAEIDSGAFSNCTSLASIDIPDSVATIGAGSFSGCTSLANVSLGAMLEVIGSYAFSGCTALTSIFLPASVVAIGEQAFWKCSALESIEVDSGNSSFVSTGTVLYDIDCTRVVAACPAGLSGELSIPNTVTAIDCYVFYGCTLLESASISNSVVKIEEGVFSGCSSLAAVYIPESVTYIDYAAFSRCSSLTDVYYEGSEEEWDEVYIDTTNLNPNHWLTDATIHFNSAVAGSSAGDDADVGDDVEGQQDGDGSDSGDTDTGDADGEDADSGVTFVELAGETRYETSELIAEYAFGGTGSEFAVVATGTNYPDALAAASLAGVLDAPVVLAKSSDAAATVEALEGLGVSAAYIVGGTSAVSGGTEAAIEAAGIAVERVYGANRYATAIAIADEVLAISGAVASGTCIVAAGGAFPDALSASPYAYWSGSPIYLANKDGSVSAEVVAAIEAAGYERVVVLGGTSAVSMAGYAALAATGADVERVSGANRYATSVAMAQWSVDEGMGFDGAAFATGTNYPDALSGSALCGRNGSVMLLVSDSTSGRAAVELLGENSGAVTRVFFLGGTSAVSASTRAAVKALF